MSKHSDFDPKYWITLKIGEKEELCENERKFWEMINNSPKANVFITYDEDNEIYTMTEYWDDGTIKIKKKKREQQYFSDYFNN